MCSVHYTDTCGGRGRYTHTRIPTDIWEDRPFYGAGQWASNSPFLRTLRPRLRMLDSAAAVTDDDDNNNTPYFSFQDEVKLRRVEHVRCPQPGND